MHHPTIPAAEYPARWRKVQAMTAAEGLDVVVAYADDRAVFGPAHARWFTNFPAHFEPVCILMPRTGDPVMLVGPESDEYALLAGQIPDVRILKEFTHPDEDYPFTTMESLAKIIGSLGLGEVKRIGIGACGLMNADVWAAFQAALPAAEWIEAENLLCDIRAQKSSAEIAVIRKAYSIAEAGLEAAIATIAPSVTERAVAAKIEADDMVLLTIAPRYEGYHAAIGRPVLVGNVAPELERALTVAVKAQEACHKALRPSVEGRGVEAIGRRSLVRAKMPC